MSSGAGAGPSALPDAGRHSSVMPLKKRAAASAAAAREAALAIEMSAEALDIGLTIHPHPTLGEGVMEAAKAALGEAVHIMN